MTSNQTIHFQPLLSMPISQPSPQHDEEEDEEEEEEETETNSAPGSPDPNRRNYHGNQHLTQNRRPPSSRPDSRMSNDASSIYNSRPNSGVSSMRSRPASNMSVINSRSKSMSRLQGKQTPLHRSTIVSLSAGNFNLIFVVMNKLVRKLWICLKAFERCMLLDVSQFKSFYISVTLQIQFFINKVFYHAILL